MKTSSSRLVPLALLCLAAVAIPLWQQSRLQQLEARLQTSEARAAELDRRSSHRADLASPATEAAEIERLRTAENELKAEVARLRALVTQARRTETAPLPSTATDPAPSGEETPRLTAGMTGMMKGAIEQQLFGQLERLKTKLELTAEQEEAIRALYTRQVEQAVRSAERMFGGRLSREEMQEIQRDSSNLEESLQALLTPEQLTRYAEHKQEEATANARLVANAELLQMQGALGLTPEQQDQVFNALYNHTVSQLSGNLPDSARQASDPSAAFEAMVGQKVQALQGILTPEQLESYRRLQEQQANLIKAFLPAAEPGAGAPAPERGL